MAQPGIHPPTFLQLQPLDKRTELMLATSPILYNDVMLTNDAAVKECTWRPLNILIGENIMKRNHSAVAKLYTLHTLTGYIRITVAITTKGRRSIDILHIATKPRPL